MWPVCNVWCVCICAVFLCVWSVLEMSGQRTRRSLCPSEWRPTRSARHSVQSCHWQPTNRWRNSKAADTRLLPGFESSVRVSYCCTSLPVTQWKLEFLMPKVTNGIDQGLQEPVKFGSYTMSHFSCQIVRLVCGWTSAVLCYAIVIHLLGVVVCIMKCIMN